jgi:hypothetical protein
MSTGVLSPWKTARDAACCARSLSIRMESWPLLRFPRTSPREKTSEIGSSAVVFDPACAPEPISPLYQRLCHERLRNRCLAKSFSMRVVGDALTLDAILSGEGASGAPTGRRHRVLAQHANARGTRFVLFLFPFPNFDALDKQPQAQ